ncbi:MAG: YggT family protein [Gammaproteobacteria bacterium AqS3]|nr:YggT family protein [Gammaproteobacteria bacterium AqS3]
MNLLNIVLLAADLYGALLVLRWLLPVLSVDYTNPACRTIVRLTQPLHLPLASVPPGPLHWPSLLIAWLWFAGLLWILYPDFPLGQLISAAVAAMLLMITNLLFITIIAWVILSWVSPNTDQPLARLAMEVSHAACAPVRQFLPSLGGLDLSPVFVLLLLNVLRNLVSSFALYQPLAHLWFWL